jgi:hypothetical protein
MRRWEQVKRGDGQVDLISGEPGIGKSRIAETILERLSNEPHIRLRYFSSPHHQDSALYPNITQLERAACFRREDSPGQRLAKLETLLAQGTDDLGEAVPLVADLLSIPMGDRYPPLNLTPQKRKQKTLLVLLAQVAGLSARQPVLMVFEDMHWSDPTSRELLDLLIERLVALPVLAILTYRPEFNPPWIGRPHVSFMTLNRLPPWQTLGNFSRASAARILTICGLHSGHFRAGKFQGLNLSKGRTDTAVSLRSRALSGRSRLTCKALRPWSDYLCDLQGKLASSSMAPMAFSACRTVPFFSACIRYLATFS